MPSAISILDDIVKAIVAWLAGIDDPAEAPGTKLFKGVYQNGDFVPDSKSDYDLIIVHTGDEDVAESTNDDHNLDMDLLLEIRFKRPSEGSGLKVGERHRQMLGELQKRFSESKPFGVEAVLDPLYDGSGSLMEPLDDTDPSHRFRFIAAFKIPYRMSILDPATV